ncbi:putative extensin-like [Sesbania bispinosa]|nr:putative extensin-like [Sesbania bispinosa]
MGISKAYLVGFIPFLFLSLGISDGLTNDAIKSLASSRPNEAKSFVFHLGIKSQVSSGPSPLHYKHLPPALAHFYDLNYGRIKRQVPLGPNPIHHKLASPPALTYSYDLNHGRIKRKVPSSPNPLHNEEAMPAPVPHSYDLNHGRIKRQVDSRPKRVTQRPGWLKDFIQ